MLFLNLLHFYKCAVVERDLYIDPSSKEKGKKKEAENSELQKSLLSLSSDLLPEECPNFIRPWIISFLPSAFSWDGLAAVSVLPDSGSGCGDWLGKTAAPGAGWPLPLHFYPSRGGAVPACGGLPGDQLPPAGLAFGPGVAPH